MKKSKKEIKDELIARTNDYKEIEDFIYSIKSNCYWASTVDLFRLVHIYDLAFPKLVRIPCVKNIEVSCELMFWKVCCWYVDQKSKRKDLKVRS